MSTDTYTYDEKSLLKNGRRWFPIMGEMHYSRVPAAYWKEELLKMKAGGVDIVSSYVIWIHHEETKDGWDWSGCRDLRSFVQAIADAGLTMILRVGPWSHAEVRNGGFPDYLMAECKDRLRTNDDAYLARVKNFFAQIYAQVQGLFVKDGGPIIGIQVENEYGHCGGLTGPEGERHMTTLVAMLKGLGFDVPLWTATGWGGAVTAGLLPVMGGYCDAPWDSRTTEIEPSGNFVFTHERNDHAIGSDFGLGEGVTFDMTKFPYLTAELGGGLQVTYKRRPVATAKDIVAMSIAKLGSGCTLLGYYMYHGGTNPDGKLTSLEETTTTGSFCDLPEKSYDFMAPLGEYGIAHESYFALRELAGFVHQYGEELCDMQTFIPDDNPLTPTNFTDLRYAVRFNKETGRGFLFVNNYQRRNELLLHEFAVIDLSFAGIEGTVKVSVANGDYAIYLLSVTHLADGSSRLDEPKKVFPCDRNLVTLPATGITCGTDGLVYEDCTGEKPAVYLETTGTPRFYYINRYPNRAGVPAGFHAEQGAFGSPEITFTATLPQAPAFSHRVLSADKGKLIMSIHVDAWPQDHFGIMCNAFLVIRYAGNCARLYENGKLVADSIYMGLRNDTWRIGLRQLGKGAHDFTLEVDELNADSPVYLEEWPDFAGAKSVCKVYDIGTERSVRVRL